MSDGPLYLGLDLSTQQLKAIIVQSDLQVVSEAKVDFDADLGGKYGVSKGVLTNEAEGEVFAPVAMWLEAVDMACARLCDKGAPLNRLRGIGGSGQQHGSVWWGRDAEALLGALRGDGAGGLVDQLEGAFSHAYAPNWQDHSTQRECELFNAHLGGPERGPERGPDRLAEVTGSAAHHRFTGPQILRLREKLPDMYASTSRISLVSSFLASVFLGNVAPIDVSDVCGMNLWDISTNGWSEPLLELTAGGGRDEAAGLRAKLGEVRLDGGGSMGTISGYFATKYGFAADCQVVPFTGDNPATILALPLRAMDAMVSLGTSTTFLMVTPAYRPDRSCHLFNHPCTPGQYMFMLCYKNGALARERVRDALPGCADGRHDLWAEFNELVLAAPPLHMSRDAGRAKLGLYFDLPEIVPNVRAGTWRYTCDAADGGDLAEADAPWPAATDARTMVESQALSVRLRSRRLAGDPQVFDASGLPPQPRRVYLAGGGSGNPAIARVFGDVLGGTEGVYRLHVGGNACALGGAYKAVWALERTSETETFDAVIGARWHETGAVERVGDGYREGVFERYGRVLAAFEDMERRVEGRAGNS